MATASALPSSALPSSGNATGRRRLSPEARQGELLDAAAALAVEAGDMAAASLDLVAERAGCSRNLAYRYFPNHRSLVEALAERERLAVFERLSHISLSDPFDAWFNQVVGAVLELAEQRGQLLLMLFDEAMFARSPERRAQLNAVFVRQLERAGVSHDRAETAAPILAAAVLGAAGVMVNEGGDRAQLETQLRRVADALIT